MTIIIALQRETSTLRNYPRHLNRQEVGGRAISADLRRISRGYCRANAAAGAASPFHSHVGRRTRDFENTDFERVFAASRRRLFREPGGIGYHRLTLAS